MATWGSPRDGTVLSGYLLRSHVAVVAVYLPVSGYPVEEHRTREKDELTRRKNHFTLGSLPYPSPFVYPYSPYFFQSFPRHPTQQHSMSSNTYALLQYDGDPLSHRFIDHEGRLAFTM
jgi:hypothetical protein